ncbi:hypothetical protein VTN02DRAFT_1031 [Thermoascus thermophilus]
MEVIPATADVERSTDQCEMLGIDPQNDRNAKSGNLIIDSLGDRASLHTIHRGGSDVRFSLQPKLDQPSSSTRHSSPTATRAEVAKRRRRAR